MGGIQGREGSIAEVHAVRGGQLILRVAPSRNMLSREGSLETTSNSGRKESVFYESSRCCILEQSMDVLEKIFVRLSPRDLALLTLTCRTMHLVVSSFLTHYVSSYGLRGKLTRFYETHRQLLLPKEQVLKDRLELNSNHQLLLYSAMHQFLCEVRRVSLVHVDHFHELRIPNGGVVAERDVALKRDVVVVKRAATLNFLHKFNAVAPGRYCVQIRIRLSNVRWDGMGALQPNEPPPSPRPAVVRVTLIKSDASSKVMVLQHLEATWWHIIDEYEQLACQGTHLEHARVIFDADSDWFFLRLEDFHIEEEDGDLEVSFEDGGTADNGLRQGVILDFVELRKTTTRNSFQ